MKKKTSNALELSVGLNTFLVRGEIYECIDTT